MGGPAYGASIMEDWMRTRRKTKSVGGSAVRKQKAHSRLRLLRLRRGLTMDDVERASAGIAFRFASDRYMVRRSYLSAYERGYSTPSIFKLYSLKLVYRCTYATLITAFGAGVPRLLP